MAILIIFDIGIIGSMTGYFATYKYRKRTIQYEPRSDMTKTARPAFRPYTLAAIALLFAVGPLFASDGVAFGALGAKASLRCSAHVDNAHPTDYSTVLVTVKTSSHAHVVATAHYKSTDTTHASTANGSGTAIISYRISRATSGFPVIVNVSVSLGASHGSCKTTFTPT